MSFLRKAPPTGWHGNVDAPPLHRLALALTLDTGGLDEQTGAEAVPASGPHHKRTGADRLLSIVQPRSIKYPCVFAYQDVAYKEFR